MAVRCPGRRLRPTTFVVVCLVASWLTSAPGHAAPTVADEPEIKAQFFERFTRFIDWPASALGKDAPFVVCLTGGSQLASAIERRMVRTTVKGLQTEIRRLSATPTPDPGGCHALYLGPALRTQLPTLLARTRGRPILTVGDSDGFSREGVLINMYIEDRFVRFEINDPALKASGLKASSKLLRLARMIDGPAAP
jgi:YfiR/HmsC-like